MDGQVIDKFDEDLNTILNLKPEELENIFSELSLSEIDDLITKLKEVTEIE